MWSQGWALLTTLSSALKLNSSKKAHAHLQATHVSQAPSEVSISPPSHFGGKRGSRHWGLSFFQSFDTYFNTIMRPGATDKSVCISLIKYLPQLSTYFHDSRVVPRASIISFQSIKSDMLSLEMKSSPWMALVMSWKTCTGLEVDCKVKSCS